MSQGKTVSEVCRVMTISDQTYYRWRKEYGEMGTRGGDLVLRRGG